MSDTEDDTGSESGSSIAPEDTLVGGRAKRVNAGNRLSHLLQHLDDEDVKADLLAEEEDDQKDYSASEDGDGDVAFDSSDESEDEGKTVEDELAGEKELKKQERVESKRKRKARELVRVQPMKKRVKIEAPTYTASVVPAQPKKPRHATAFRPTRHSSRSQTIASAKLTEAKYKENRKRALKTQEVMRLAAERRAAEAEPELTQADRMARALEIEKDNSRSLNRWERSEQERVRLQKEKLEAMRNRKLDGPVIRYWSGPVTWIWREGPDGHPVYARCKYLRQSKVRIEEVSKETSNTANATEESTIEKQGTEATEPEASSAPSSSNEKSGEEITVRLPTDASNHDQVEQPQKAEVSLVGEEQEESRISEAKTSADIENTVEREVATQAPDDNNFLNGIHLYANDGNAGDEQKSDKGGSVSPQPETEAKPVDALHHNPSDGHHNIAEDGAADGSGDETEQPDAPDTVDAAENVTHSRKDDAVPGSDLTTVEGESEAQPQPQQSAPTHSTLPLHRERAARALVILEQFPHLSNSAPLTTRRTSAAAGTQAGSTTTAASATPADPALAAILLPRAAQQDRPFTPEQARYLAAKPRKTATRGDSVLPPAPEKATCAISGRTARFRDPRTRLPYADMAASKAIQRVMANGCQYSALLGVWAGIVGEGSLGRVARGVPEGFWSGEVKKVEVVEL